MVPRKREKEGRATETGERLERRRNKSRRILGRKKVEWKEKGRDKEGREILEGRDKETAKED